MWRHSSGMKNLLLLLPLLLSAPAMAQSLEVPKSSTESNDAVWLLMRFGSVRGGAALHSIPMADLDQCEMAGAEFTASKRLYPHGDYRGFECLEGIR